MGLYRRPNIWREYAILISGDKVYVSMLLFMCLCDKLRFSALR